MNNIELYINGRLCDITSDFSVRLNRQLLKPSELNAKDAQYSYSINLPATGTNNAIFRYSNIEETKNKFNHDYNAELIINSLRVFKGKFLMQEISRTRYRGNLYIPAPKSIQDVFSGKTWGDIPRWEIDFTDFVDSVNRYNDAARLTPQPAIFPYVLYGLLPKDPVDENAPRDLWDESVQLGMSNFPPSINPVKLLEHVFSTEGYTLEGNALQDDRLTQLYMSYSNDPEYAQPWNYGQQARIRINGAWSNVRNMREPTVAYEYERNAIINTHDNRVYYSCNLFDANNTTISVIQDDGNNVTYRKVEEENVETVHCDIRVPASGLYKITLDAGVRVIDNYNWVGRSNGIWFVGGYSDFAPSNGYLDKRYEVKLLRNWGADSFGVESSKIDGVFYNDNFEQNNIFDGANEPKYFPQVTATNQTVLIDPAQNVNHVLGVQFGSIAGYNNPRDEDNLLAQTQAAKPKRSSRDEVSDHTRLATPNPGYWRWGYLDDETLGWEVSDELKIDLINVPQENFATRGTYGGQEIPLDPQWNGSGRISAVVWLEANERLTIVTTSDRGSARTAETAGEVRGWVNHELYFDLDIVPFRTDEGWLKLNSSGSSFQPMDWNDESNFDTNVINLIGFLQQDMSVDSFINNFCKAFNLRLSMSGVDRFSLDVKQQRVSRPSGFIDLDNLASVRDSRNTSLGLPSLYRLGFTVDKEEEGYVRTIGEDGVGDDGGGDYYTGSVTGDILDERSDFSYNWFKRVRKSAEGVEYAFDLPIISNFSVWEPSQLYSQAMLESFTDLAHRFWYYDGLLNDTGASFTFGGRDDFRIAKVSNILPARSVLNYKDIPYSILNNFFTLLIGGSSHYTEVEGYLSPIQYGQMDGTHLARFNGDMYFVAEISGYDPTGRNKTKILLIRMI